MTKEEILDAVRNEGSCQISQDNALELFPWRMSYTTGSGGGFKTTTHKLIPGYSGLTTFAEQHDFEVHYFGPAGVLFRRNSKIRDRVTAESMNPPTVYAAQPLRKGDIVRCVRGPAGEILALPINQTIPAEVDEAVGFILNDYETGDAVLVYRSFNGQ